MTDLEENLPILATAEGLSGKIEVTEISVRITEYKKELFKGWNNKKIHKINEIQRKDIVDILLSEEWFNITILGGDNVGLTIFYEREQRPGFEGIADELNIRKYWYDNDRNLSNVISYDNEEEASIDANKAAIKGWMVQSTSATDGHVNVGLTVGKFILTGGIGLAVLGESRTKGKVTITYARTPEWLEVHKKGNIAKSNPTANDSKDTIAQLERLAKLKEQGILIEEEFQAQKKKILGT